MSRTYSTGGETGSSVFGLFTTCQTVSHMGNIMEDSTCTSKHLHGSVLSVPAGPITSEPVYPEATQRPVVGFCTGKRTGPTANTTNYFIYY